MRPECAEIPVVPSPYLAFRVAVVGTLEDRHTRDSLKLNVFTCGRRISQIATSHLLSDPRLMIRGIIAQPRESNLVPDIDIAFVVEVAGLRYIREIFLFSFPWRSTTHQKSVSKGTTSHFTRGGFNAPERTSDTTTRQDARCRPFVETSLVDVVATGGFAVDDLFVVCDEVEAADGAVLRDRLAQGGFVVCML